ncbi:MAG: hypothetical protein AMXMBFR53_20330 [Gemmatimonadota bacterium]
MRHRLARDLISRDLDVAVALEVGGYRWVEWNHAALRGAPLDAPGRFLAHEGDPLGHLHVPASPGAEPSEDALARVPHYAALVEEAFRAAQAAGVFTSGGARLEKGAGGWRVEFPSLGVCVEDLDLCVALCTAALRWAHVARVGEGRAAPSEAQPPGGRGGVAGVRPLPLPANFR